MIGANARATIARYAARPPRDPDTTHLTYRQWERVDLLCAEGLQLCLRLVAFWWPFARRGRDLGQIDEGLLARQCGVSIDVFREHAPAVLPEAKWVVEDKRLALEQKRKGGAKGGFSLAARQHAARAKSGAGDAVEHARKCMGAIENQRLAALAKWAVDCQRAKFHGEPEPPHPEADTGPPELSAVKWVAARLKGAAYQMGRGDMAPKVAQAVVDLLVKATMRARHSVEYRDIEAALLLPRAAFVEEWAPARWDTSPGT